MEMVMLPRIATPVTVPIQSPQDAGNETAAGAGRPQLSPEALANLRAAVVLRLLEAMMRQIGQGGETGNAARQLLDVLLAALKTLPPGEGRDGEATRRLAILIARLPAEMRPAAEKLLSTVLSSASTRTLLEVIRNPGGPDAQHLAQALLVAAGDIAPDDDAPAPHGGQRFIPAEAQLAAAARQALASPQQGRDMAGDSRSLQNALRHLFEGETGVDARAAVEAGAGPRGAPGTAQPQSPQSSPSSPQSSLPQASATPTAGDADDGRMPSAPAPQGNVAASAQQGEPGDRAGFDQARLPAAAGWKATPAEGTAAQQMPRAAGPSSAAGPAPVADPSATAAARQDAAPAGAPVVHAAAGRGEQDAMMRLIAGVVANLTEDEALVLRLLLNVPLPEPDEAVVLEGEEAARAVPRTNAEPDRPASAMASVRDGPEPAAAEAANAARASARPQQQAGDIVAGERLPGSASEAEEQARAAVVPVPAQPDRPALPLIVRDGLAVPFVPYLPAQDDLDTRETPRGEEPEDEEETGDTAGENAGENGGGNGAGGDDTATDDDGQLPAAQADTPDMAQRRRKIEELVGPPDPGFAYYQKLGEYWT